MKQTTQHYFSVSKQRTLLITLCVFATSIANAFEATINGLVYDLTGVSAKVVSVASGNTNTYIEIPETVEHEGLVYTITNIGSGAFCNYTGKLHYYVDGIQYQYYEGPHIFSRMSMQSGRGESNSYVRKIILPKTIHTIEDGAFYNTNITDVLLQEGVTSIGKLSFSRTNLTSIIIPTSVTSFGENGASIFEECDLLRTIIYRGSTPPTNWVATSNTYVPSAKNYVSPTFRINSAQIIPMISWNESEFDYNGLNPMTSWTNNMNEYNATLNMPALNKNVGDYDVEVPVTFTKGGEGFTINCMYSYTVKPLTLSAKVQDEERVYGDENPIFKVEYSGFVNGEDESVLTTKPTITTTATAKSDVGAYPITINDGVATNYNISYEPGTLTVNKAPLIITVSNETKVYGENNPSLTLSYEGLKNGETVPEWITRPEFSTAATQNSDVGTYTVSATCEARNYDVAINYGNIIITPAPLTIKANNASRLYFAENPDFTCSYRGFVNNDNASCLSSTPELKCDATIGSKAGEYTISVYGASAKNYNITYENATLTIGKRTLVVTPNNAERIYGEENPEFTDDITGFVNNETEDVISEMPTIYTNAKQTSNVGSYEILAKDGSADNYIFTYKKGTLTIEKADQTITWEQDLTGATVGDQIELSATTSSGLTVEYVIDSDIVSPYNVGKKLYLDCLSEGTTTIKALQNGGTNYNPAVRVVKEMVISERNGTVPHNTYQDVNQDGNVDSQDVLEIYDYMQKH